MNFVAQIANEIQPLAREGLVGLFGAWLCLRVEKRLDRIDHTMKGLSAALLMDLVSRNTLAPSVKKYANDLLEKMKIKRGDEG